MAIPSQILEQDNAGLDGGFDLNISLGTSPVIDRDNGIGNEDDDNRVNNDGVERMNDDDRDADANANLEEKSCCFTEAELPSQPQQRQQISGVSDSNQDEASPMHDASDQHDDETVPSTTDIPGELQLQPQLNELDPNSHLNHDEVNLLTCTPSYQLDELDPNSHLNHDEVNLLTRAPSYQRDELDPNSHLNHDEVNLLTRSPSDQRDDELESSTLLSFSEEEPSTRFLEEEVESETPATQVSRLTSKRKRAKKNKRKEEPVLPEAVLEAVYPWSAPGRAKLLTADEIVNKGIVTIKGELECGRCKRMLEFEVDFKEKFMEVADFLAANKISWDHRAPESSFKQEYSCQHCSEGGNTKSEPIKETEAVRPVMEENGFESANWLFLLLGKVIGHCHLNQLKYFCQHNNVHRTGAKDRNLYYTVFGIFQQLDPCGNFDVE